MKHLSVFTLISVKALLLAIRGAVTPLPRVTASLHRLSKFAFDRSSLASCQPFTENFICEKGESASLGVVPWFQAKARGGKLLRTKFIGGGQLFIVFLSQILFLSHLWANLDLDAAYKREYIFLSSQKKALMEQKEILTQNYQEAIQEAQEELDEAQKKVIDLHTSNESEEARLFHLEQSKDMAEENKTLFSNTVKQIYQALEKEKSISEGNKGVGLDFKELGLLLDEALVDLKKGSKRVSEFQVPFFLSSGQLVKGDIHHMGRIASFGHYQGQYYMLSPAGQGKLKVWREEPKIEAFFKGRGEALMPLFIYENLNQSVERNQGQNWVQFISAGGSIAWVIVAMGMLAMILCLIRMKSLGFYSKEVEGIAKISQADDFESLLVGEGKVSSQRSFFLRLFKIKSASREFIDDVVDEGILHEHKIIDRFGTMILVFAALSPLLGLLGTVTGMISTFDIITEHGTGDPKLLSQGISEALITTQLGLVVAIPALFFGNMLSSWGKNIKINLDKTALKVINDF